MLLLTFASGFSSLTNAWRSHNASYRSFIPTIIVPEEKLPVYPDPDDNDDYEVDVALQEVSHLVQASIQGYSELLKVTAKPAFRNFVEVILRQRQAENGEHLELLGQVDPQSLNINEADASLVDPNTTELRVLWLRAVWNLEQEQFNKFAEQIELAESMLEDAYLNAAEAVPHQDLSNLFRQHAMNVCGARQRLEELVDELRD